MTSGLPQISIAETLAHKIVALKPGSLPAATTRKCEDLLIDVVGLCVTARKFRNLHVFGCWWFMNVPSITTQSLAST